MKKILRCLVSVLLLAVVCATSAACFWLPFDSYDLYEWECNSPVAHFDFPCKNYYSSLTFEQKEYRFTFLYQSSYISFQTRMFEAYRFDPQTLTDQLLFKAQATMRGDRLTVKITESAIEHFTGVSFQMDRMKYHERTNDFAAYEWVSDDGAFDLDFRENQGFLQFEGKNYRLNVANFGSGEYLTAYDAALFPDGSFESKTQANPFYGLLFAAEITRIDSDELTVTVIRSNVENLLGKVVSFAKVIPNASA